MKLHKKPAILAAAALMAMTLISGCGQAKIGYIDSERVMQESPQIKAIADEGQQKILEAKQDAENQLTQNPNLTQEEAQKIQVDAQRKLNGLNQSYTIQIKQKLDTTLADISKQKELDVVVDSTVEQPVAITGCIDVTDDVIQKLQ